MTDLVDQPNILPNRKIAAVGIGSAGSVVMIWLAAQFGLQIPTEVANSIVAIIGTLAGYFVREKEKP